MSNRDSIDDFPFNVWNSIASTFQSVLSEHDVIAETKRRKCSALLDMLLKNRTWLVPVKNPHSDEYTVIEEDRKRFSIWLFGQLFSIFLNDCFERLRKKCLDTQIELLQDLWENDPAMYGSLLRCYQHVFQDLCTTCENVDTFAPTNFKWFDVTSQNVKLKLWNTNFRINNIQQVNELVNLTLSLLISQVQYISHACTSVSVVLWKLSLSLLLHFPNRSLVFKLITRLLLEDSSSTCQPQFNVFISELLLRILNDVSLLCQSGKLNEEEDFCATLNTLREKLSSDACFDFSYVYRMYSVLLQCQISFNESTEDSILQFLEKLTELSNFDVTSTDLEANVSLSGLSLLRVGLEFSIGKVGYGNDSANVYRENKYWKFLIEHTLAEIRSVNHSKSKQVLGVFKLVRDILNSTVRITYERETRFVFFEDKLRPIMDALMELCEIRADQKTLLLFLEIVKNVHQLDETQNLDENYRLSLTQLLYLRWTSSGLVSAKADSFYQKYSPLVDARVREFCIIGVMWARRYQVQKWADAYYDEMFRNLTDNIGLSIPVLVSGLKGQDLDRFIDRLLKVDDQTLTAISYHIRLLVCALSGHSVLCKLPRSCVRLYCILCDEKLLQRSITIAEGHPNGIKRILRRLMNCTENAKLNVLSVAVDLFKHSASGEELLGSLHEYYLSEDPKVREKMIEITPYVIFPRLDEECYEFDEAVFNKFGKCLRAITLQALVNGDENLQYVCLKATTKIGCVPLEITLRPCVVILVILMLSATSFFPALAKSCIQQVGIAHDVDQEDHIYLKYAEQVFPFVVRTVVTNFSVYNVSLTGLTCDHASVFNRLTANRVLQYLLPYVADDSGLQTLVTELATLCDVSVAQLLRNAFRQIFPHIMLFEDVKTMQNVMNFLCKETNSNLSDLLSCCVTKVLAELFVHYEEHEQKVKYVLCEIKRLATSKMEKTPPEITTPNVESFLQSRFFGVLMKLENQLCTEMISQMTKRQILSSFKSIIQFMTGAYITSVRFKVLFTLRTISDMERESNPSVCVDIWDTFVRKLDTDVLGPIISNIFVSLLPFVEAHYDRVNAIFRYLVVENCEAVSAHLLELYFVQAHQCDPVIFRTISQSETALLRMNVEDRLEWLLEATKHEITEIKLQALRRLKHELANNRKELSQLILASDSVSSLIFRVLDTLVDGFRNLDPNIQEASGACLGEFGAIDPSYIPNKVIKEEDNEKYNCYEINDVKFVVKAFTLLCRGFQMAKSSSNMDAFALAIQSLLTSYEVKQDERCKYWSQIPKNLREIIQPFYSTTYILTNMHESTHDIPHLVYGSNKAQTVQKWAYNWSNFLISLLPAESKPREVFTYCKGPMSCEIKCMQLFLPHILLSAVLNADAGNLTKIYEEMISVIKYNKDESENSAQKSSTQLVASEELSIISNTDMEMGIVCTKTMFNLLDVLQKKYRDMQWSLKGRRHPHCEKLRTFLSKFSKNQLTEKSFERKEYVRSLLYLEEYLATAGVNPDKYLVLLAKIYVHLSDVDNVKGLFAKYGVKLRQLQNLIMLHEITDQYQDAAICYQQLLKTTDKKRALGYERRMIQCYLAMNQPETALRFVNSLSATDPKSSKTFYDVECEALWNLSQYDKLETLTSCKSAQLDDSWGVRIGQSIVHFLKGNRVDVDTECRRIRETLTKSLHMSTAAFGSYRESYEHAVKLHILNEFEKVTELVYGLIEDRVSVDAWKSMFQSVVETEFEERLNKLRPTSKALQPVLNIRQTLFDVAGRLLDSRRPELASLFHDEKRKCWLKVIEIANRTRNFQLAYSNIIAIDNYQLKGFFIEKAKYYWEKNEQQEALRTLQHGLQFHFSNFDQLCRDETRFEDKRICAEGYILMGTYNDAMANTDYATNLQYFQNAYEVCKHSEKSLVKVAQYQDKILKSNPHNDELYRTQPDRFAFVMEMYGKSLEYGCEFIYQSMSRVLNVWLDFGLHICENKQSRQKDDPRRNAFVKMNKDMHKLVATLPTYYFLTAFSLIMSRLSHPLTECFHVLQQIVIECTLNFRNQSLWQFMSLHDPYSSKSTDKIQLERVNKVLNDTNLAPLQPIISKFKELFQESLRLCECSKSGKGTVQLTSIVKRGSRLLQDGYFEEILVPYQKFLTIVLPRSMGESAQPEATYNPFPEKMVYIAGVRHQAHVYTSMQKPVRVGLVGTDGQVYPMIIKSQDDMRIDSRAMEFNAVVNMYLKRDVESRDRGLHIRTYTALPLPKKCGIIEFIPALETIRAITNGMRRCLGMSEPNTTQYKCDPKDSVENKLKCFQALCELYPGVLQEWYKMEFPNPSSWYCARTAYVRTLAVMSIVGYMLGLGDRHNDNIMIDTTNGDVVHVDFNALFNKGETLAVPERVPFRLTHSMVKAMGPLGYEGGFVYTCEIVNRVLRSRKDQLISVLNTFLYDPLDFFASGDRERANNLIVAAQKNLQNVESRLSGSVRSFTKGNSIPLSVEGQTRRLIEEATDVQNLCHMFFGWGAYM